MDKMFEKIKGDICRGGGNGPYHPSQFAGLRLVDKGESLLDVGCGSATTAECIIEKFPDKNIKYKGVDFIPHRIDWCRKLYPKLNFEIQDAMKLKEADNSWDIVYSRHVVDHLKSFEEAIDEQIRVARKKVICILWYSFCRSDGHTIKNIEKNGIVYKDEYLNSYNLHKIYYYLLDNHPDWGFNIYFRIGNKNQRADNIIYLYKIDDNNNNTGSL